MSLSTNGPGVAPALLSLCSHDAELMLIRVCLEAFASFADLKSVARRRTTKHVKIDLEPRLSECSTKGF